MLLNAFHIDGQQAAAFAIVALAAGVVLRRFWGQIVAFRSRPARRKPSASSAARPQTPRPQPLIQIQTAPPRHMKRPSADDTRP